MALAEYVLALHRDIHEALILEERAGEYVVVDAASRGDSHVSANTESLLSKQPSLAPTVILGTAEHLVGQQSKLVIIEKAGLVLAPLSENKILVLSVTPRERLRDVWQTISAALPQIKGRVRETPDAVGAVVSTAEAENHARQFLAGKFPIESSRIRVNAVTYRRFDQQWEVYGSFRSPVLNLPRHFQIEVDATDGAVKRFVFYSSSTMLIIAAAATLVVGLLVIMLFAGFWKL